MTEPADRLLAAEAEAVLARERLSGSFAKVQAKLNPKRIARRAVRDVGEAGASAAGAGVDTARRYPVTLAGIVAAAGLLLARHRIAHLVRRARGATDASGGR